MKCKKRFESPTLTPITTTTTTTTATFATTTTTTATTATSVIIRTLSSNLIPKMSHYQLSKKDCFYILTENYSHGSKCLPIETMWYYYRLTYGECSQYGKMCPAGNNLFMSEEEYKTRCANG